MKDNIYGIIVAAGRGLRMGGDVPKQYRIIDNKPIIAHTLAVFDNIASIKELILVTAKDEKDTMKSIMQKYHIGIPVKYVNGGRERQESVYNGLKAVPKDADIVVIHDGVRPLVNADIILNSIKEARIHGACVVGMPVKDTIKRLDNNGFVQETPPREGLWLVQTPQTFQYDILVNAYKKALDSGYAGTDDAMIVEWSGERVKMIEGSYQNIKITTGEDLLIAEQFIHMKRNGDVM